MNSPRFVIDQPGWETETPYDIYTLVAEKLQPDLGQVPMTSALRDPCVLDHLAKMTSMIANIADGLDADAQIRLASSLGYSEVRYGRPR